MLKSVLFKEEWESALEQASQDTLRQSLNLTSQISRLNNENNDLMSKSIELNHHFNSALKTISDIEYLATSSGHTIAGYCPYSR